MKAAMKAFIGKWRIVEMEAWDQDYVDTEGPGYFAFKKDGTGTFSFGLVGGDMDCRIEPQNEHDRLDFSWVGCDEMDSACGRGWAVIENGALLGHIFFHLADDSAFRAVKSREGKQRE